MILGQKGLNSHFSCPRLFCHRPQVRFPHSKVYTSSVQLKLQGIWVAGYVFNFFFTLTKLCISNKLYNIEQKTSSESKLKIQVVFFFFSLSQLLFPNYTCLAQSLRKLTQNKLSYVNCKFPF